MRLYAGFIVCSAAAVVAGAAVATAVTPNHRIAASVVEPPLPAESPVAATGARGWTWASGAPGYRFGHDESSWNLAKVRSAELTGARLSAASSGIRDGDLRVLNASRVAHDDLMAIVAMSAHANRTCLGFLAASVSLPFYCPDSAGAQRLGTQVAFVITDARTVSHQPYLIGIARGDVTKVVLRATSFNQPVYARAGNDSWGTFDTAFGGRFAPAGSTAGPEWLDFYSARGRIASLPLKVRPRREQLSSIPPSA